LKAAPLRGEVVLVDFNPARPGEAAKRRPAVVVSNDLFNAYAPVVVVVPLTSKVDRVYPTEVPIDPEDSGLEHPSKAQVHLVRHVSKNRILKSLGQLEAPVLREIDDLLRELLGL